MTNSHPDDDPLVPRDVPPADSYLLNTSVSPSGILSSAPATVYPTTSTPKVNSSRGTASVSATSLVSSLTPASSGLLSTSVASLSNGSSLVFASSIYLTSSSKLSIETSASGVASLSASTISTSFSGNSNISQNLPISITALSSSASVGLLSSSSYSTPDTIIAVSPTLVTTTVTASDGAPSTIIITTTQSPDTTAGEIMSSSQPSQAATTPAAIPTGPSLEAVIGGVNYQLPSSEQDAIVVMLHDGSIAQLLANKIIIGGQTVTVLSDLTSETALSDDITAKPGKLQNRKKATTTMTMEVVQVEIFSGRLAVSQRVPHLPSEVPLTELVLLLQVPLALLEAQSVQQLAFLNHYSVPLATWESSFPRSTVSKSLSLVTDLPKVLWIHSLVLNHSLDSP
ncbi:hypothetical protein IG631_05662 [Alternaria alternata]|nr:hypothetical protein IG631_05662 [Alternaria alternata]